MEAITAAVAWVAFFGVWLSPALISCLVFVLVWRAHTTRPQLRALRVGALFVLAAVAVIFAVVGIMLILYGLASSRPGNLESSDAFTFDRKAYDAATAGAPPELHSGQLTSAYVQPRYDAAESLARSRARVARPRAAQSQIADGRFSIIVLPVTASRSPLT